ncbi:MAG: membrane protein insertase YidC [Rhizobiales bacterium]|nr:membrane protein insertase YidC [Hyphomicrobiales bacterium]
MDKDTNKNLILALVLSLGVLIAWELFYGLPKMREQQAQEAAQQQAQTEAGTPAAPAAPDGAVPSATPGGAIPQPGAAAAVPGVTFTEQDSKSSGRIEIVTDNLSGSLNLKGARFDDLRLVNYREKVDPDSPVITLLGPENSTTPFYVDEGWIAAGNKKPKVPDTNTVWTAAEGAKLTPKTPVTLTWDNGEGLTFRRTISIDDGYMFTISREVRNTGTEPAVLFPYSQVSRHNTPVIEGFFILHEGLVGVLDGELEEIDYSDVQEEKKPQEFNSTGGWMGITDKYWAVVLVPDQNKKLKARFGDYPVAGKDIYRVDYLSGEGLSIAPGATAKSQGRLFAGAKVVDLVDGYAEKFKIQNFDLLIDWGWFYFITKPMFFLLQFFHGLVGNFGVAIILATVVIKLVFFPLANKSYVSMSKMKMLQPEMQKIKERFGDDRQRQQQAMMELYKKEKVNPISGCLPVVIQIPVFFALYKVLFGTIDMRHAPFVGWIQDLSAKDPTTLFNLFGLLPYSVPDFMIIGVWPIIMGVTMFIQMKLNPAPPDPIQAQIFAWMPLFFTFLLASFPAGLVIYWAWNNTLSVTQQYVIMRRQGVKVELWKNMADTFTFLKNLRKKDAKEAE